MPFIEVDRRILDRCLQRQAGAWEEFVDRFIGVFIHVIRQTAHNRSVDLTPADIEDLCSEIFLTLLKNDFAVLRHFKGKSSLATYLAVVARRVTVKSLIQRRKGETAIQAASQASEARKSGIELEHASIDLDEVRQLMNQLPPQEAQILKLFYIDGLSYHDISTRLKINENSIGPTLHRARERLRQGNVSTTS